MRVVLASRDAEAESCGYRSWDLRGGELQGSGAEAWITKDWNDSGEAFLNERKQEEATRGEKDRATAGK